MIYIKTYKKLHTSYGDIVLDCEIELKKGDILGVFGESGSGKTTLLRIIAGLEKSNSIIKVDNHVWQDEKVFLPPFKRDIGFVFQDYGLFPNMSVLENLLYAKNDKNFANELLEIMKISNLKNRYPNTLSGGQKQRVAIARAIMRRPKILLLDEAFSALDINTKESIYNDFLILYKKYKFTTILVSHMPSEIYKLANKMIVISKGKIKNFTTPLEYFIGTKSSEKFAVEGEIIDIINADILKIAIVNINENIVEVVLNTDNLKIGDKVIVSTKAFNLNIRKKD